MGGGEAAPKSAEFTHNAAQPLQRYTGCEQPNNRRRPAARSRLRLSADVLEQPASTG